MRTGAARPSAPRAGRHDVKRVSGGRHSSPWRAAALATARGMEVCAHCPPHLHAHAAAAVPNVRHLEWFHDHVRIENLLFAGALDPSGGSVRPATG